MKNWLDNSIPWKVSSLVLERGALFLLIGFSVFLGGSRALGLQEALLMLFFIPVIAWIVYRLEISTPTLRHWAHIIIFAVIALLVISSLIHLSKIGSGVSWNPFPILVMTQLLMGGMIFERHYHSMILETTMMSLLLLLMGIGKTVTGALLGILLVMVILCYLRFSFAVSQWARTVNRERGLWQAPAASVSYRQIFSVVGEGMLILLIGLGIGFLMTTADWKISLPKSLMETIGRNIPVDVKGFASTLSKEERAARELEEMEKLLQKKPEPQQELLAETEENPLVEQPPPEVIQTPPPEPPPAQTQPTQPEEIPVSRLWPRVLLILGTILLAVILLVLLGSWLSFWMYRMRTRKYWRELRRQDPRRFLKEWVGYLRNFLERFGFEPALFLSPAEYAEGILNVLKITLEDDAVIKQILLKAWYSSSPVTEQDLRPFGHIHQNILRILKKRRSWRQRLQLHCLGVEW